MKPYTCTVDIDLPRNQVVELIDSVENLYCWQEGLQSVEHISGEPGQEGARMKMSYKMGKREMVLEETIIKNNLPDAFDARYEWPGGWNMLENRFIELGPEQTRWDSKCTFGFGGLGMRVMGTLFPGMFKKESMKYSNAFKAFCETGADVREQK